MTLLTQKEITQYRELLDVLPPDHPNIAKINALFGEDKKERCRNNFLPFVREQALRTKAAMLDLPVDAPLLARWQAEREQSLQDQAAIEAGDSLPFDMYLQEYLSPKRLLARPVLVSP